MSTDGAPPTGGSLDRARALRIISKLRTGTNCLEATEHFSAGRESLLRAASALLEELELSGGAVVKWLDGSYGQGKTHYLARLMAIAHERNWVTSYVLIEAPGQGVELHHFEGVYGAIVKNCLCRDLVREQQGQISPGTVSGWKWILDDWCNTLQRQCGAGGVSGVQFLRYNDAVNQALTAMQRQFSVNSAFAEALRHYALAVADYDVDWQQQLLAWFGAEDVLKRGPVVRGRLRAAGITEAIVRRNAKDMLRSLSAFLRYRGYGGLVIMLDEVENVLHASTSARRGAYTTLRELVDNVDDVHGMTRTAFYVSGTPDLFTGEKGITEYDALAQRVLLVGRARRPNPNGVVVELAQFPLHTYDFIAMAERITAAYVIATAWRPAEDVSEKFEEALNELTQDGTMPTARRWVRRVVEELDSLRI